jgi:teichuronic acid biosynthesis glycosyltransferase TuaC
MRILVISQLYPNVIETHLGIFAHRQVKELVNQGCEIRVISPKPWIPFSLRIKSHWPDYNKIPSQDTIDGIKVYYPRYLEPPRFMRVGYRRLDWYYILRKFIIKIHQNYSFDIIHSYNLFPDGFVAMRLGNEFGVPSVSTAIGYDTTYWPFIMKGVMKVTQETIMGLDQIIAVCKDQKYRIEQLAEPKNDIKVIYPGLDTKYFTPRKDIRKKKRIENRINESSIVLFFAGTVIKSKGIFELITAYNNLKFNKNKIVLVIAGNGPDYQKIREIISEPKFPKRVIILGQVNPEEIKNWFQAADIFVFPSYTEGLSNALSEAMANEKAIIVSNIGGNPEIITHNKTGILIPAKDSEQLHRALERLIRSKYQRKRLARAARLHAENELSIKKIAKDLENVFKTLIKNDNKYLKNDH